MLNEAQISLTGYVATQPLTKIFNSGAVNVSMRVAWTPRWIDRATGEWADGNTSYITVICWRKLATNVALCVRKGDPVVVTGRLTIRAYDDREGNPRSATEIEATSVGHDLCRGVAQFQRTRPQTGMTATEFAAIEASEGHEQAVRMAGPDAPAALVGADGAGTWAGPGANGMAMPDEPGEDFFGAAAEDDPGRREPEPAAVKS
jgi:single-strand DNA-binding protein